VSSFNASVFRKLLPEGNVYVLNFMDLIHTGSEFRCLQIEIIQNIFFLLRFDRMSSKSMCLDEKLIKLSFVLFCDFNFYTRNVNQLIMTMFTK